MQMATLPAPILASVSIDNNWYEAPATPAVIKLNTIPLFRIIILKKNGSMANNIYSLFQFQYSI